MPTPEQRRAYQKAYRERKAKEETPEVVEPKEPKVSKYVEDETSNAIRSMTQWQRDQIIARLPATKRRG